MLVLIFSLRASIALYLIIMLHLFIDFVSGFGENSTKSMISKSRIRNRRYLVYPTPGSFVPTKVQLIMGLGLPMEVDVSMIIGYVLKFNYALPYNASYLTQPHNIRYDRSIDPRSILDCEEKQKGDEEKRRREEIPIAGQAEETGRGSTSRWEMYRVIESALDSFQVSGKSCLLKTVCQVAEVPFENTRAGLAAQLIHVLLTPSTTTDKYQLSGDQEYHFAEVAGRKNPGKCKTLFPECEINFLEYFTEIDISTRY